MSAYYRVNSDFLCKIGALQEDVKAKIKAIFGTLTKMDGDEVVTTRIDQDSGRVGVEIQLSHIMGYGTMMKYDECWEKLVLEMADFSNGAISVEQDGDSYNDGAETVYVGSPEAVRTAKIAAAQEKIKDLQAEIEALTAEGAKV